VKAERQFQGEIAIRNAVRESASSVATYGGFQDLRQPISSVPRVRRFYSRYGKRTFDIAFAATFMLSLGFWLLPLIALIIKLDSPGPAFFRQRRVGLAGAEFTCLKFRTMSHEPGAGFRQTERNDPRITRVGAFLRKTNLDELPQFINVLLGQMSVVGPRPHVSELDEAFSGSVPSYSCRNLVRPGVTGLAQISGCRGETRSVREMNHRVRFDVFYIRSISFTMDLRIIVQTALKVVQGDERAF